MASKRMSISSLLADDPSPRPRPPPPPPPPLRPPPDDSPALSPSHSPVPMSPVPMSLQPSPRIRRTPSPSPEFEPPVKRQRRPYSDFPFDSRSVSPQDRYRSRPHSPPHRASISPVAPHAQLLPPAYSYPSSHPPSRTHSPEDMRADQRYGRPRVETLVSYGSTSNLRGADEDDPEELRGRLADRRPSASSLSNLMRQPLPVSALPVLPPELRRDAHHHHVHQHQHSAPYVPSSIHAHIHSPAARHPVTVPAVPREHDIYARSRGSSPDSGPPNPRRPSPVPLRFESPPMSRGPSPPVSPTTSIGYTREHSPNVPLTYPRPPSNPRRPTPTPIRHISPPISREVSPSHSRHYISPSQSPVISPYISPYISPAISPSQSPVSSPAFYLPASRVVSPTLPRHPLPPPMISHPPASRPPASPPPIKRDADAPSGAPTEEPPSTSVRRHQPSPVPSASTSALASHAHAVPARSTSPTPADPEPALKTEMDVDIEGVDEDRAFDDELLSLVDPAIKHRPKKEHAPRNRSAEHELFALIDGAEASNANRKDAASANRPEGALHVNSARANSSAKKRMSDATPPKASGASAKVGELVKDEAPTGEGWKS